ncbi:hypothetical protein ISCGN_002048 [Ixodes scapularis]
MANRQDRDSQQHDTPASVTSSVATSGPLLMYGRDRMLNTPVVDAIQAPYFLHHVFPFSNHRLRFSIVMYNLHQLARTLTVFSLKVRNERTSGRDRNNRKLTFLYKQLQTAAEKRCECSAGEWVKTRLRYSLKWRCSLKRHSRI